MIAYLRIIVNPDDDAAFERTINNPPRGIGQRTIDIIRNISRDRELSLWKTIKIINDDYDGVTSRIKASLDGNSI